MARPRNIPDPVLLPVQQVSGTVLGFTSLSVQKDLQPALPSGPDVRSVKVDEFLQGRSLKQNTCKGYRQDLQHFLNWTEQEWTTVTSQQIQQFRSHLLRFDVDSNPPKRALSDASVRRILGTLKKFYDWMQQTDAVLHNPTRSLEVPVVAASQANPLHQDEVDQVYGAISRSRFPERNRALISVLFQGLTAQETLQLNIDDFDGQHLAIADALFGCSHLILCGDAIADVQHYLDWRGQQNQHFNGNAPLFVSYSRRSWGNRLSYDGLRDVLAELEKATGLELHAHRFRDTFATKLLADGIDASALKMLMRQKSEISARRYGLSEDSVSMNA